MTLAVGETLSTNKQSNKQKETKDPLNFSMMSYGIASTAIGSGSILLNRKPKNGFQGSEKRNTSSSYQMTPNRSNKDKKLIPARNSRYLDDLLNIDNPYFEQVVGQIYPTEL